MQRIEDSLPQQNLRFALPNLSDGRNCWIARSQAGTMARVLVIDDDPEFQSQIVQVLGDDDREVEAGPFLDTLIS